MTRFSIVVSSEYPSIAAHGRFFRIENPLFMALANAKFIKYFIEARAEMKKVVWPSRKETRNHTLVVIGLSLAVAIFIGVVDYLLNLGLGLLIA